MNFLLISSDLPIEVDVETIGQETQQHPFSHLLSDEKTTSEGDWNARSNTSEIEEELKQTRRSFEQLMSENRVLNYESGKQLNEIERLKELVKQPVVEQVKANNVIKSEQEIYYDLFREILRDFPHEAPSEKSKRRYLIKFLVREKNESGDVEFMDLTGSVSYLKAYEKNPEKEFKLWQKAYHKMGAEQFAEPGEDVEKVGKLKDVWSRIQLVLKESPSESEIEEVNNLNTQVTVAKRQSAQMKLSNLRNSLNEERTDASSKKKSTSDLNDEDPERLTKRFLTTQARMTSVIEDVDEYLRTGVETSPMVVGEGDSPISKKTTSIKTGGSPGKSIGAPSFTPDDHIGVFENILETYYFNDSVDDSRDDAEALRKSIENQKKNHIFKRIPDVFFENYKVDPGSQWRMWQVAYHKIAVKKFAVAGEDPVEVARLKDCWKYIQEVLKNPQAVVELAVGSSRRSTERQNVAEIEDDEVAPRSRSPSALLRSSIKSIHDGIDSIVKEDEAVVGEEDLTQRRLTTAKKKSKKSELEGVLNLSSPARRSSQKSETGVKKLDQSRDSSMSPKPKKVSSRPSSPIPPIRLSQTAPDEHLREHLANLEHVLSEQGSLIDFYRKNEEDYAEKIRNLREENGELLKNQAEHIEMLEDMLRKKHAESIEEYQMTLQLPKMKKENQKNQLKQSFLLWKMLYNEASSAKKEQEKEQEIHALTNQYTDLESHTQELENEREKLENERQRLENDKMLLENDNLSNQNRIVQQNTRAEKDEKILDKIESKVIPSFIMRKPILHRVFWGWVKVVFFKWKQVKNYEPKASMGSLSSASSNSMGRVDEGLNRKQKAKNKKNNTSPTRNQQSPKQSSKPSGTSGAITKGILQKDPKVASSATDNNINSKTELRFCIRSNRKIRDLKNQEFRRGVRKVLDWAINGPNYRYDDGATTTTWEDLSSSSESDTSAASVRLASDEEENDYNALRNSVDGNNKRQFQSRLLNEKPKNAGSSVPRTVSVDSSDSRNLKGKSRRKYPFLAASRVKNRSKSPGSPDSDAADLVSRSKILAVQSGYFALLKKCLTAWADYRLSAKNRREVLEALSLAYGTGKLDQFQVNWIIINFLLSNYKI